MNTPAWDRRQFTLFLSRSTDRLSIDCRASKWSILSSSQLNLISDVARQASSNLCWFNWFRSTPSKAVEWKRPGLLPICTVKIECSNTLSYSQQIKLQTNEYLAGQHIFVCNFLFLMHVIYGCVRKAFYQRIFTYSESFVLRVWEPF